jgi:hypothetical protein
MTELFPTSDAIIAACAATKSLAPAEFPTDLAPDRFTSGARTWYSFEHAAWQVGETIRLSFQATPRLKRDPRVVDAVVDVVRCRNLRRGRQSFVMALGFTGAARCAPTLAGYLTDPDLAGHVVDTLLKMRAAGYGDAVSPLLEAPHAWIRNLARRYLDRYVPAV